MNGRDQWTVDGYMFLRGYEWMNQLAGGFLPGNHGYEKPTNYEDYGHFAHDFYANGDHGYIINDDLVVIGSRWCRSSLTGGCINIYPVL